MFEYIQGKLSEINPSYVVVEAGGIGYFIHISLFSYEQISGITENQNIKIYLFQIVREDAHILFGFAEKQERELFKLLLSVNGVGANTARMMLSSLTPNDLKQAIVIGDVNALKAIKGIGLKTAQRIIVDLKDKVDKVNDGTNIELFKQSNNTIKIEALSALTTLGFNKAAVDKILDKIVNEKPAITVEELVREGLKRL